MGISMETFTSKAEQHFFKFSAQVLFSSLARSSFTLGDSFVFSNIYIINCGLQESVEVDESIVVGYVKNVVYFEELIQSTQRTSRLTRDKLVIQSNVVAVNLVSTPPHG